MVSMSPDSLSRSKRLSAKTTFLKEYMRLRAERKDWLNEPGLSQLEQWDRADEVRDEALSIVAKQWKENQDRLQALAISFLDMRVVER